MHMKLTVLVMALIGITVYSTTYALMYAATSNATVPVLEMWMVTTHLACATLSVLFSRVKISLCSSIYFGVACGVTILGNDCIQYGRCELYFGAAAVPRIAAAGAIAWAWVMYAVSLDGVPDAFVAALAMAMVPLAIETKTAMACGDKWRDQLATTSGSELLWVRAGVAVAMMLAAMFLRRWIFALHPVVSRLILPRAATPLPYYFAVTALVLLSYFVAPRGYPGRGKSLNGGARP